MSSTFQFAVLGIVDVNAIPEDKKGIPIGGDDNPIPLVKFTNPSQDATKKTDSDRKPRKRPKKKKKRK